MDYEVIIVGGGPAGLSGALALGRCARRVLVCDDGHPRNAVSRGVHGFLTRDGTPPDEFLRLAREQALAYPTVTWRDERVADAERFAGGFRLTFARGDAVTGRKVLLATGLVDELPQIEGLTRFWGKSAFVCPFCDAWEVRGQRFAVVGRAGDVYEFALELRQWSPELFVCTDGPAPLNELQRAHLARLHMPLLEQKIARLEGHNRDLERLRFVDGSTLETRVVFLTTCQHQRSHLAEKLGCVLSTDGLVPADVHDAIAAEGVWVAGNASAGLQMAIMAAAEGFQAAHAINEQLVAEDLRGT